MAEVASAFVSLMPSAKGFGSKLDSQIGGDVTKSGKSAGAKFGGALKLGAVAALGGAAVAVGFLKGSLDEAREAQKVGALTASTIKATGGAAKVTAKQVSDLAGAISLKTGIDDETIQSGQNMLLTFKGIRNEAGKGNDVFNQATKTLVDMSAAMGSDPKKSAIQLGKALNDPIKGVTALSKVGVTFTDGQKKQIKTLVESGHAMTAQKIILKELNSEFGGAAEAQATAGDKAKVAFGNLQEAVGTALLPVVDKALNAFTSLVVFLTTRGGPALFKVQNFFASLGGPGGAGGLLTSLVGLGNTIRSNFVPVLQTMAAFFVGRVLPAVSQLAAYLSANLLPIFSRVASIVSTQVIPIIGTLAQFLYGTLVPAVLKIYIAVAQRLKPIFDELFKQIQTSILPSLQKLLAKFREYQPTIQRVVMVVLKVDGAILKLAASILGTVLPVAIRLAGFMSRVMIGTLILVVGGIIKVVAALIRFGAALGKGVADAARFASAVIGKINNVVHTIAALPGKITGAIGNLGHLLYGAGSAVIQGLIDGVTSKISALTSKLHAITSLIPKHKGPIDKDKKLLEPAGKAIMDGLLKGLEAREKALKDKLASITQKLADVKNAAKDFSASVAQNFTTDAMGGTLADLRATLTNDTNNAKVFAAALKAAVGKGLSGALLNSVAASGNIGLVQEIAGQSKKGIADLEKQFAARANAAAAPGKFASNELFGDQIREQTNELKGIRKDLAAVLRKERAIHVHDKSGDPKRTARDVARREAFAGGH